MVSDTERWARDKAAIAEINAEQAREGLLHVKAVLSEVEENLTALRQQRAAMIGQGDRQAERNRRLNREIHTESERKSYSERLRNAYEQRLETLAAPPRNDRRATHKRSKHEDKRDGVMFAAIQANYRGLNYCEYLDRNNLHTRPEWQSEGCPLTYVAAYRKRAPWPKKIQDQKHRSKLKYDRTPPAERERLIQSVSRGTR